MPETSRVLYLHSPSGSDVAVYKWPLHITETWNEANEIAETVRWACSDFPELRTAMENCILSHFDPSSYESMKLFCEKYNRAVDNIRKLVSSASSFSLSIFLSGDISPFLTTSLSLSLYLVLYHTTSRMLKQFVIIIILHEEV
jgi:hypothetical protein